MRRLMGKQKALEMFTLDVSMSAKEAESHGLVTRVFPKETFRKETEEKLKQLANLPFQVRSI